MKKLKAAITFSFFFVGA